MSNEQQKAKEWAGLLTAFAIGKQLQYQMPIGYWVDYTNDATTEMICTTKYPIRIKPETKRVPLTMQDLIDRELREDTMRLSNSELILSWHHNFLKTVDNAYSYSYLLDNELTFLDGTPCYKEVSCE